MFHSCRRIVLVASMLALAAPAFAQGVGINATGAAADTSAILDLSTSNKGFLPPRMTAAQRGGIVQPATGLVVYQTDGTSGLYYNVGGPLTPNWRLIVDSAALVAVSGWLPNGTSLYYNGGKVGMGTTSPTYRVEAVDSLNGLRVQTNTAGGTVASFGGFGSIRVDAPGVAGGRLSLLENGNLGLGTATPGNKLSFAAALGKKISLYPGASGDAGFGIAGNRLQIYSDNSNADVALGYDAAGLFNERFAFKPNGAMAVSGNTGAAGQVLQSNGAGAAVTWAPAPEVYSAPSTDVVTLAAYGVGAVPGMSSTFTTTVSSKGVVNFTLPLQAPECLACPGATPWVYLRLDGVIQNYYVIFVPNGKSTMLSGTQFLSLAPGPHTIDLGVSNNAGNSISAGLMWPTHGEMTIQVFAQ
jgi:hypothetical protein